MLSYSRCCGFVSQLGLDFAVVQSCQSDDLVANSRRNTWVLRSWGMSTIDKAGKLRLALDFRSLDRGLVGLVSVLRATTPFIHPSKAGSDDGVGQNQVYRWWSDLREKWDPFILQWLPAQLQYLKGNVHDRNPVSRFACSSGKITVSLTELAKHSLNITAKQFLFTVENDFTSIFPLPLLLSCTFVDSLLSYSPCVFVPPIISC